MIDTPVLHLPDSFPSTLKAINVENTPLTSIPASVIAHLKYINIKNTNIPSDSLPSHIQKFETEDFYDDIWRELLN